MIAGALFLRYSMLGLGRTLAAGTRQAQTEYASELLRQLVIDCGRVIQQDRQALEQAVRLQAREVERRLSLPPVGEPRLFFNADYAIPGRGPGDLQPSDRHFLTRPDGVRVPIAVSYGEQVYFAVAGVARQSVAQDMARLATMPEAYAFARRACPDLVCWQYTSLDCGFHTSYPGHGGYPPEYDPRTREWYVRARDSGDVTWLVMPEVSSRTVAQTVTMPVRRADGSFAGVTALDVPFSSMFQQLRLPQQWAAKSQAMLVTLGAAGSAQPKAEILVSRDYERHGEDWQMPLEMQYLESGQPEQLQRMLREASGSPAPVVRMGYTRRFPS